MTEWREAFCPVCGRTMGMRNIFIDPKRYWTKTGMENKWKDTLAFTGDKPFGVVKSSEGRGTLKTERYYDIDEDAEGYFPLMKARLLAVIKEWLDKDWVTREEVEEAIK